MENQLQFFKHEKFGRIRVVMIDGVPWFVGNDVANSLGYKNPRQALKTNVDDRDKGVQSVDTLGGKQKMVVINESGLYSMILSSQLPDAKDFRHWVTSEVLPSVFRTGNYSIVNESTTAVATTAPKTVDKTDMARVYVLSLINKKCQRVKIGHSKNIRSRVAEIKNDLNNDDDKFFVNNMYFTPLMPREIARFVEWATQEIFSSWGVEGEFFSADFDKICDAVNHFVKLACATLPQNVDFDQVKEKLTIAD